SRAAHAASFVAKNRRRVPRRGVSGRVVTMMLPSRSCSMMFPDSDSTSYPSMRVGVITSPARVMVVVMSDHPLSVPGDALDVDSQTTVGFEELVESLLSVRRVDLDLRGRKLFDLGGEIVDGGLAVLDALVVLLLRFAGGVHSIE